MKKQIPVLALLFFVLLLSSLRTQAQYVYIPDPAFRTFLLNNGYSGAMNGDSLDTTSFLVTSATSMNCSGSTISSLEGIQYFTQLQNLSCGVNYLTTLPPLTNTLRYLNCRKNMITALPPLPVILDQLVCENNNLTSLPALPVTLQSLICRANLISTLPNLPASLGTLICDSNFIQTLPTLNSNLQYLDASSNLLTFLPTIPTGMKNLYFNKNTITELPVLPDSLEYLSFSKNQVDSLPVTLPSQLLEITYSFNLIDTIYSLPQSLKLLYGDHNLVRNLPTLPDSLITLIVGSNNLTSLPALPSLLETLSTTTNTISALPVLPLTLKSLIVNENDLDTLLPLPPTIRTVNIQNNHISHLPQFPSTLKTFYCDNNTITELPALPDTMLMLYITQNPISCLPPIKKVSNFKWSQTLITCLPNYINATSSIPDISNLPLCQPSSGCEIAWNISGSVYNDLNNNCIQDSAEDDLIYFPVHLDSAGVRLQTITTTSEGKYAFRAPFGSYDVTVNPAPVIGSLSCPPLGTYSVILNAADSIADTLNFGMMCPNNFDLVAHNATPMQTFRPTRFVEVKINAGEVFGNFGSSCYNGPGIVTCDLSGPFSYVSPAAGALTPSFTLPGTLTWNISDFSTIDPLSSFNIIVHVDSFAPILSSICFQLRIVPTINDADSLNNLATFCYPVLNSFDPNEKLMVPSGSVDTSNYKFQFTVFFQNTGNAPAENIFIIDTLDADLDASTIEVVSSSHYVITQLLPGNILRFNFPSINLIDSLTNEPLSHGQVQFTISRAAGTGIGTEITNTAYIYFDQNLPITTNKVTAIVTSLVGVNNLIQPKLQLYPNPVSNTIHIINPDPTSERVEIYNLIGEKIYTFPLTKNSDQQFDISELLPGVYIIQVRNDRGSLTGKFVKQ